MTDSRPTLASALRTVVWRSVRRQSDGTYVLTFRNPEAMVQQLVASAQDYMPGTAVSVADSRSVATVP